MQRQKLHPTRFECWLCAQVLCDYILNGGSAEAFMTKFKKAVSPGFDPTTMLDKVLKG